MGDIVFVTQIWIVVFFSLLGICLLFLWYVSYCWVCLKWYFWVCFIVIQTVLQGPNVIWYWCLCTISICVNFDYDKFKLCMLLYVYWLCSIFLIIKYIYSVIVGIIYGYPKCVIMIKCQTNFWVMTKCHLILMFVYNIEFWKFWVWQI